MRIGKLHLDKSITETKGIKEINLERLGSVVALIGKNGSGKSRILDLIEQQYMPLINFIHIVDEDIAFAPQTILDDINRLGETKKMFYHQFEIEKYQRLLNSDSSNDKLKKQLSDAHNNFNMLQNYPQLRQQYTGLQQQPLNNIKTKISQLNQKYFRRINYSEIRQLQPTIDPNNRDTPITFENLIESVAEQQEYNEFKSIHRTALNYLSKLPHQLVFDLDDCYGDTNKSHARVAHKRFVSLKKLIKTFLNKDLEWEQQKGNPTLTTDGVTRQSRGIWKLNGRPLNYREFSEGEKTLFAYSLLFFLLEQNPNIRIKESIIVIDEPEINLHPESELAVINGIRKVIEEKGQLWIATHSINILADLSYDEIFMVKDNAIVPPSKTTPENSFVELMGLTEHIEKLSYFVTNISNWAFLNFMTQCFYEPDVIKSAQDNDPEVDLFKQSVKLKSQGNILLDFGAGKGRIYKEIERDGMLNNKLQYSALEIEPKDQEELQKLKLNTIYKDYSELPDNSFDYILMCNVLHEIKIQDWENILNKIKNSLKDDGYIILIEDMRLPKGEKVEEEGFIIMDLPSIEKLFSMTIPPSQFISSEEKYKDRILCALIPKKNIGEINQESIVASLKILQANAKDNIKELRKHKNGNENKLALGRLSAFYSQLFINAQLSQEKLEEEKKFEKMKKEN